MDELVASGSLTERAHEQIRTAILSGELAAGTLHSIYGLARDLGVSRTPVREALVQLSQQGMVQFERNRGVRILERSLRDLEEIFSLRLLLEVPATRRAAREITDEELGDLNDELEAMVTAADARDEHAMMMHDRSFHSIILRAAGNERLADIVDDLRDLVMVRGASTAGRSRTLRDIIDEHVGIMDALQRHDPGESADLMLQHLENTARLLFSQEVDGDPETVSLPWIPYVTTDSQD